MSGDCLLLPPEILSHILTNLPVKSILRFRCVCKTWYSLISCSSFVSAQTLNLSTVNRVLVHRRKYLFAPSSFSSHEEPFVESHEHHDAPPLLRSPCIEIVGSCDGLICLCICTRLVGGDHRFLIWNPSIRKLVELPFCKSPSSSEEARHLWGFGFDSESRDYKVLRAVYHRRYGSTDPVLAEPDIFDLRKATSTYVSSDPDLAEPDISDDRRKGAWRRSSSSPMRPYCYNHPCVYLYGNLHWIGSDGLFSPNFFLLSFNLSSEVLQELGMVPGVIEIYEENNHILPYTKVMPINGLLSVAVVKEEYQVDVHRHCISVWSMKEYGVTESWTKMFNIELPHTINLVSLQHFRENGEVLLVEWVKDDTHDLVLYNTESRKSKAVFSTSGSIHNTCFYKESLVLL